MGCMEEVLRNALLDLAARYEAATGQSAAAIGKKALNDNTFFVRIQSGAGFNIKTLDKLLLWFSENWPEGTDWPEGVERPFAGAASTDEEAA
jgi:hypothetical protein